MTIAYLLFGFSADVFTDSTHGKSPMNHRFQPPWAKSKLFTAISHFFSYQNWKSPKNWMEGTCWSLKQNSLGTCWSYHIFFDVFFLPETNSKHLYRPLSKGMVGWWNFLKRSPAYLPELSLAISFWEDFTKPRKLSESFGWFRFRNDPLMKGIVILRTPDSNPKPPGAKPNN